MVKLQSQIKSRYILKFLNTHFDFVTCKTKVLARFNCAIFINTLPGEKLRYVFTTTSEARVFSV